MSSGHLVQTFFPIKGSKAAASAGALDARALEELRFMKCLPTVGPAEVYCTDFAEDKPGNDCPWYQIWWKIKSKCTSIHYFWPLDPKASPITEAVNMKTLIVPLKLTSHNIQKKGGTEWDVFCFLREAETVGLGKMSWTGWDVLRLAGW